MKMDFSKFKKIKSDNRTTTLQHPDGHEIKIAHAALSAKLKKEISKIPVAMAEGGAVGENSSPDEDQSKQLPVNININTSPNQQMPAQNLVQAEPNNAKLFENVKEAYQDQSYHPPEQIAQLQAEKPNTPVASTAPSQVPQVQLAQNQANDQYSKDMNKAMGIQRAGIYGEAKAISQQGKDEALASQNNQMTLQKMEQDFLSHQKALEDERKALQSDIDKNHINPNHYQESLSTGQKIKNAIGLILGGMGAGLTHSENPAMQFINSQIERDLLSQQNNMAKQQNLLKANLDQFGNLRDAMNMTRAMQNDIYSSQLKQAAAKAMEPMAKARALQAAGQLDAQSASLTQQLGISRTMASQAQNPNLSPTQKIRFLVPEKEQAVAAKEIGEHQKVMATRDFALDSFDHLNKKFMKGALTPGDRDSAIWAIAGKIQKDTEGRFNLDAAQKLVGALFPSKGDLDSTASNKRERLIKLFQTMTSTPTLEKYGINPYGGSEAGQIKEMAPKLGR